MLKSSFLICMLWMVIPAVMGQAIYPGAVHGPVQWYSTDTAATSPGLRNLLDRSKSLLSFEHASIASFNFHPSLVFSGATPLRINLGNSDLRSATYFTVYHSIDTSAENSIWHMTSNQQTTLVLTTHRMADLPIFKYMNYHDVVRIHPKVNVYVQYKENDSVIATNQWWNIGTSPASPQLPIIHFKGLIPEIIAYDRVLNGTERLQVASYLALKYGITLTEPNATYLNSFGQKVWDGYDYPDWHHNIAGICRDDSSGLYQSISCSSNTPGLLTIAAKDSLFNNTFLLWGDNGNNLIPAPHAQGFPMLLQKTWLMKTFGNSIPFITDLVLDTKPVDAALPVNPVYWLAIDRTGEAKFNPAEVEFIKMDKLDKQGKAYFKNIAWDKDGSGKDVLGIIAARDLLLATSITQPDCASPQTGSLQIKILGGQAPFQLSIQSSAGTKLSRNMEDATTPISIANLGAGKYFLHLIDARENIYTDSFYINNADVPVATYIDGSYVIAGGRSIQLNAAENMPGGLTYEWSGPENFQSYNPQVTIAKPGLYTLRCTRDGCSNAQDITVTAAPDNALYNVTVYPNPSQAVYHASVALDKPAMVNMAVYSPDGKLVSVQKGTGRANYLFTGQLATAGIYRIVFTSGLSKTTKTLVIVK